MRLMPARRAKRRMAGLVMPLIDSPFRICLLNLALPLPLPLPEPAVRVVVEGDAGIFFCFCYFLCFFYLKDGGKIFFAIIFKMFSFFWICVFIFILAIVVYHMYILPVFQYNPAQQTTYLHHHHQPSPVCVNVDVPSHGHMLQTIAEFNELVC